MIRLCVAQCFYADEDIVDQGPTFIHYGHSCAKNNCLAQCDAVIFVTKHPGDTSVEAWSLSNSTMHRSDLTWFCDQNPRTRFLLNNNVVTQISNTGCVVDASNVCVVNVDGNMLTPKYEPRVPVTQEINKASKQHMRIAMKSISGDKHTTRMIHIILCHGHDRGVAKWDQFDVGDDPVVFIRLCTERNNDMKGCVYLGEVPGVVNKDLLRTSSQDYFMQCEWSNNVKYIQIDAIESKTMNNKCILSGIVAIELK